MGRLVGLTGSRSDLNGVQAKIISFCVLRNRYEVRPQYRAPGYIKGPWLQPSQTPAIITVRPEQIVLPVGASVKIVGLQQAVELNEQRGVVESFSGSNFRYRIRIHRSSRLKPLKAEHCIMPRYRTAAEMTPRLHSADSKSYAYPSIYSSK